MWSGFAYVAFVTDVFSKRIVGWRVSNTLRSDLALEMAIWTRKEDRLKGLVHQADLTAGSDFHDAVLATLGGSRVMDFGQAIGYGTTGKPEFWIGAQQTGEGFRVCDPDGNNVEAVCHVAE